MSTKCGRERRGEKQEINSSEVNTAPNSQYNINFGRWLAFILFCLDEQICYKNSNNIWVVTASSASYIRVIVLDKNKRFLFFLIIHLLNFLLKNSLLRTYTIHHVFVNSALRGKK